MNSQAPPPPTTDLVGPFVKGAAIVAAGKLGLFGLLSGGPLTPREVAKTLGASEDGMRLLMEALASVGYLERVDDRFANGPVARTWMTPASVVDFTPLTLWISLGLHLLIDLDLVVKRGGPERPIYEYLRERPEVGQALSRYMKAMAKMSAPGVIQALALPQGARRLLDLGGSHGLYSIALCQKYPNLRATVFDMPVALSETMSAATDAGLAGRISIAEGDYLKDDIGTGYDVILCFSIVHNHILADNKRLIAKIARSLNQGGIVAIHDFIRSEPPDAFNALYSLLFFMYSGTRNYSYAEVSSWLQDAGLDRLSRTDIPPGQSSIITAYKRT